jgi:AraC family transcriptional regulator, transcriptional activator FtrA
MSARPARPARPPRVVSIAYNGWSLFEAGIVNEVYGLARPELPGALYRYRVAQAEPGILTAAGGLEVRAHGGLDLLRRADLVVVPGWRDHRELPPPELLEAIYAAHRRGTRLLSICSGAFVLAATGLLDGRSATTHWRYAQVFRSRFPHVRLLADVLYVDEGDIVTSAGSAAGIDACIHIVRCDYGADIANLVARTMVTPPHRTGSQAQFVPAPLAPREMLAVSPVMDWARARLDQPLRVVDLAKKAAMSERSFLRHFTSQVGVGPKQWLRRERVMRAQVLLENSSRPLNILARDSGFSTIEAMRAAFKDVVGSPPSEHRKLFRAATQSHPGVNSSVRGGNRLAGAKHLDIARRPTNQR